MKRLVISILVSVGIVTFHSAVAQEQNEKTSKKQDRIDRKFEKLQEFEAEKAQVAQWAMDRDLVLEANTISGKFGFNSMSVSANNYILIDSNDFVLQTSSPGYIGQNGIGGVTIRGTIESYTVSKGANNNTNIIAQVNTFGLGPATVTLNLAGKQNCRATFSTASGWVLNMSGPVTTVAESRVYQGNRLY